MKSRIVGTFLLIVMLGGIYFLTNRDPQFNVQQSSQQSESAIQPLKIN